MVVCLSGSGGFLPQMLLPCSAVANMFPRAGGDSAANLRLRTDRAGLIDGSLLQHWPQTDRWLNGRRSIATSGKKLRPHRLSVDTSDRQRRTVRPLPSPSDRTALFDAADRGGSPSSALADMRLRRCRCALEVEAPQDIPEYMISTA